MSQVIPFDGASVRSDGSNVRRIYDLQREMARMPQVELRTEHYFADGMYARNLFRPRDTLIVGKVHKREHFFVVASGRIAVVNGDSRMECGAGTVIVSAPGTKRATLALEDSIGITFHRTDKVYKDESSLDEMEA